MNATTAPGVSPLFYPKSVAVVGVSRDATKWGHRFAQNVVAGGFTGNLFSVNPSFNGEAAGTVNVPGEAVASIADIPTRVDVAVAAVPQSQLEAAVRACASAGTRVMIVPGAGFAERSHEGAQLQRTVIDVAADAGMRILGPNCFGAFGASARANLTPYPDLPTGRIGFISQSGNLALAMCEELRKRTLGFSLLSSLGNQSDVNVVDVLKVAAVDPETSVITMYLEGLPRDSGAAFLQMVEHCTALGKKVVVLKGGLSAAGTSASASHTASIAGEHLLWKAFLADAGAIHVENLEELVDVAQCAAVMPDLTEHSRDGAIIIADGGGDSVLAADAAESAGLGLATLSPDTLAFLDQQAPPDAPRNPGLNPLTLDTRGGLEDDPELLARVAEFVVQDEAVNLVVVSGLFGGYEHQQAAELRVVERLAKLAARGYPIAVHSWYTNPDSPTVQALRANAIPVFATVSRLMNAVGALLPQQQPARPRDPLRAQVATSRAPVAMSRVLELLASAGVDTQDVRVVESVADAVQAAADIDGRVVVKVADTAYVHKSEVGGVRLNLRQDEVADAALDLTNRLQARELNRPWFPGGSGYWISTRGWSLRWAS
ncbi:CoA-binding protein [Mycolicibacterium goodii]|nr:CoA-binding protein [Mycolicibacterium goodii]